MKQYLDLLRHVRDEGKLSCQLYQRSADLFLGVPFFGDYRTASLN